MRLARAHEVADDWLAKFGKKLNEFGNYVVSREDLPELVKHARADLREKILHKIDGIEGEGDMIPRKRVVRVIKNI